MTKEWTPIHIDLGVIPVRKRARYTALEIYRAIEKYRREFLAGRRSTDRLYREFCRGKIDTPSLGAVLRLGPLNDLLKEVEAAGWELRALNRADPRTLTPEQREARRVRRFNTRLRKARRQRVLRFIVEHGSASARELSKALDCSLFVIRDDLALLRTAGLIEWTRPCTSKAQRYVLTNQTVRSDNATTTDHTEPALDLRTPHA